MSFETGPYIQTACFCDMVLEDKTGTLSIIRIIDRIERTASGPGAPEQMPIFQLNKYLVIMLKSGQARGGYQLKMIPEQPDGTTKEAKEFTVHFDGEDRGQNLIINLSIPLQMEGLYWFRIEIADELITQIPLAVRYNRIR